MKNTVQVLGILRAVSNHTVDRRGLNQLIELTQSFAFTYLKYRYRNLNNTLMGEDVTLNEMAIDAIAPLFERDDEGNFIRITNAFEKWDPPVEKEDQAVFFINRLVAKSTEKFVSEILKASDPLFSKLFRSINYLIKSKGLKKKHFLGVTYIIRNDEINPGKLPDNQIIYDLPVSLFRNNGNMLDEIFRYLKENTDRAEAIPLNALVTKIKSTGGEDYYQAAQSETISEIDIDSITCRAIDNAFQKLEESYLNKDKINEKEVNAFKNAMMKIVDDLHDGGINTGLHNYLMEEIPQLTFEDYRAKYQNIFEYLFKLIKKDIANHLNE